MTKLRWDKIKRRKDRVYVGPKIKPAKATAKQKAFMTSLGIQFIDNINKSTASKLISDKLKEIKQEKKIKDREIEIL